MNPASAQPSAPNQRILRIWLLALAVNCAVFAIYRVIFLARFGPPVGSGGNLPVLWAGLRLDAALLGFEFSLTGIWLLVRRRVRPHRLWLWFWVLTGLHAFACVGNYSTFLERHESFGELLLPYVTSPYQVYLAMMPFCQEHWPWMVLLVAVIAFYGWAGARVSRRFATEPVDLWADRRVLAGTLALALVPLLLTQQLVIVKKRSAGQRGWKINTSLSKYFTRFSQHSRNQAVINPLYELLSVQLPARWTSRSIYHLSEAEALKVWTGASGRTPGSSRYPLLTQIAGPADSSIRNVVVMMTEGLSQSLIEHDSEGRPVTPFLRRIARDGLYFPNTYQTTNFTSGGVLSVISGIPKISYEETTRRFASFEINANYGSLPRILGASGYTHYFCEGFRQSWDDFMAFTSHQEFEARGYEYFKRSLNARNRPPGADTLLGIADHEFLEECADLILACRGNFTMHCMTCTTHSPWAVPSGTPTRFADPALNAFAYYDASLQAFCERLQAVPEVWNHTLLVVLGDHTSITFGKDDLEYLRIPLIFYGPNLPQRDVPRDSPASQIDVLPTVLGLMPGTHPYAGLGRNLLDKAAPSTGIIAGTTEKGMFLKDGYLLTYTPQGDETKVRAVAGDLIGGEDPGDSQPDVAHGLRQLYFSQIELAKRLAEGRRIYPLDGAGAPSRITKAIPTPP